MTLSSVRDVLALLLVAVSLGLSNFAAAIGIGVTSVDAGTRLRVGLIFGIFEAGMPLVGLLLGHSLAYAQADDPPRPSQVNDAPYGWRDDARTEESAEVRCCDAPASAVNIRRSARPGPP